MKIHISIRRISANVVRLIAKHKKKTHTWERRGHTWHRRHVRNADQEIDLRKVAEKEDRRTLDQLVSKQEKNSTEEKSVPNKKSEKSKSKHDVLHSARKYIRRHWKVVPIRPKKSAA